MLVYITVNLIDFDDTHIVMIELTAVVIDPNGKSLYISITNQPYSEISAIFFLIA